MKKQLIACTLFAFLFTGCGESTTENQEDITLAETETVTVTDTDTIDPATTKLDNTRVEIEQATEKVDSLLNEF